ncbi:MAG: aryl-sulfate sulfotransferase [Desulfopila sp.]
MKNVFWGFYLLLMIGVFSTANAYQAMMGPTGLIYHDKNTADDSYVLWSQVVHGTTTYMIDKEGNLIHTWPLATMNPIFLKNGNLLGLTSIDKVRKMVEMDWNGNIVWSAKQPDGYKIHHDWLKIHNKKLNEDTYLMVASKEITYGEAMDAGADPECDIRQGASADAVIEMDKNGNVIWEWWFFDHVVQDYDKTKKNYGDPGARANWGKLDLNVDTNSRTGLAHDWVHVNSLDYNPTLDQIVVNSREHGEIFFIDHSLSAEEARGPKGDFLYRWGNPANFRHGNAPTFNNNGNEQLFGAHDIHWIEKGLPGAGHLLIFDNASFRPNLVARSNIYEINPYDGPMADGKYVDQMAAGHTFVKQHGPPQLGTIGDNVSNQIVWKYNTRPLGEFFHGMYSAHISGARRLPNGNTLMCAGEDGNFVEVTPAGALAWNYVNPVIIKDGKPNQIVKLRTPETDNQVFRSYPIPRNHPALAGKDLTSKGPLTEFQQDAEDEEDAPETMKLY